MKSQSEADMSRKEIEEMLVEAAVTSSEVKGVRFIRCCAVEHYLRCPRDVSAVFGMIKIVDALKLHPEFAKGFKSGLFDAAEGLLVEQGQPMSWH